MPVEFSAIANVLPSRHLSVFIPPESISAEEAKSALAYDAAWNAVVPKGGGGLQLINREREVMTLVAQGFRAAI